MQVKLKRRRFLKGLLLTAGGAGLSLLGIGYLSRYSAPEISQLSSKKELLSDLASVIIPTTETPGAAESGIAEVIIRLISDCADVPSQNRFIDGLNELEKYSRRKYGVNFSENSKELKVEILRYYCSAEEVSEGFLGKVSQRILGQPFFVTLRQYVAYAYCTSMVGATKGLRYIHIPEKYEPCITLTDSRPWATS